jgi:hypothetical protein
MLQYEEEQKKVEDMCQDLCTECVHVLQAQARQGRPVTVAEANVHIFTIQRKVCLLNALLSVYTAMRVKGMPSCLSLQA